MKIKKKDIIQFQIVDQSETQAVGAIKPKKNKPEPISTIDLLGIEIESYRKRIEFQMTSEMNWKIFEMDHVKPISSIDVPKGDKLRKVSNWIINQPLS